MQRYLHRFFVTMEEKLALNVEFDTSELIRQIIRDKSKTIIRDEFLDEYAVEYPQLRDIISRFRGRGNVISDKKIREILGLNPTLNQHYNMTHNEVIQRLYNIGFLGRRIEGHPDTRITIRQRGKNIYYAFCYNFGDFDLEQHLAASNILLPTEKWVIHPLFYDLLEIQTLKQYVVHEITWDSVIEEFGTRYHPGNFL